MDPNTPSTNPDDLLASLEGGLDVREVLPKTDEIAEIREDSLVIEHETAGELVEVGDGTPANDFEKVKTNLRTIINSGSTSLRSLMSLAISSEHPRAYEAMTGLITALKDTNLALLDVHEKEANLQIVQQKAQGGAGAPQTVNQNLFVGSTAELAAMLKQIRSKETS